MLEFVNEIKRFAFTVLYDNIYLIWIYVFCTNLTKILVSVM